MSSFSATVGSYVASATVATDLTVQNDQGNLDGLVGNATPNVSGAPINGFSPDRLQWNTNFLLFGAVDRQVRWNLTSLAAAPVPEPAPAALLLAGGAALAARHWRRRSQRSVSC